MKLTQKKVGNTAVLTVEGELHYTETVELKREVAKIMDAGIGDLVIDMGKVSYMSSSAIGTLVSANGRIRKDGGALYLARVSPELMELFELLRLTDILQFCTSTDEALAKIEAER